MPKESKDCSLTFVGQSPRWKQHQDSPGFFPEHAVSPPIFYFFLYAFPTLDPAGRHPPTLTKVYLGMDGWPLVPGYYLCFNGGQTERESSQPSIQTRHLQDPQTRMAPSALLHILLLDSDRERRTELKTILAHCPDIQVVGESASLAESREQIQRLSPDVLLVHVQLLDAPGLEAAAQLRAAHPKLRCLVFGENSDPDWVGRVIQSGSHGYVTQEDPLAILCEAIRHVATGGIYVAPRAAGRYLRRRLLGEP